MPFNPNFMPMQPFQMPTMPAFQQPSLSRAFDPRAFLAQMQQQQQGQWAQQQQKLAQGLAALQTQQQPSSPASILGQKYSPLIPGMFGTFFGG